MTPQTALLAVFALCALVARPAAADDYHLQDFPVGNRAMVLGGAFTAIGNDPSGVFYNPAGLVDSSRANISVSASLYGLDRFEVEDSEAADSTLRIVPGEVGGVFTVDWERETKRAPFAIGFTVLSPTAGERVSLASYAEETRRGHLVQSESNKTIRRTSDEWLWLGLGAGWAVNDSLSLGASAFILHRRLTVNEHITWINSREDQFARETQEEYQADNRFYDAVSTLDASDQSIVGVLGAKLHLKPLLLGVAVRLPGIPVRSSASARHSVFSALGGTVTAVDEVGVDPLEGSQGVRAETHLPTNVRFGIAWVRKQGSTLSCDLSMDMPLRSRRLIFDNPELDDLFSVPNYVDRRLLINAACGFELLLRRGLSVAVSGFTDRSAVANRLDSGSFDVKEFAGHLEDVDLYGGTLSLGMFGEHSLTRIGVAATMGQGRMASLSVWDNTVRVYEVRRSSAYVFVASTFRY